MIVLVPSPEVEKRMVVKSGSFAATLFMAKPGHLLPSVHSLLPPLSFLFIVYFLNCPWLALHMEAAASCTKTTKRSSHHIKLFPPSISKENGLHALQEIHPTCNTIDANKVTPGINLAPKVYCATFSDAEGWDE